MALEVEGWAPEKLNLLAILVPPVSPSDEPSQKVDLLSTVGSKAESQDLETLWQRKLMHIRWLQCRDHR